MLTGTGQPIGTPVGMFSRNSYAFFHFINMIYIMKIELKLIISYLT